MKKAKILTPKQQRFVAEYLIDLNATKAAIRAGYSKKTARSQGQRLLTNVDIQKAIQHKMDERVLRLGLKADEVLRELSKAAMAPIDKPVTWDQKLRALELAMKHLKLLGGDEEVQSQRTQEELAQSLRYLMEHGYRPPNPAVKMPD